MKHLLVGIVTLGFSMVSLEAAVAESSLSFLPQKGQSQEQQSRDASECQEVVAQQTNSDPRAQQVQTVTDPSTTGKASGMGVMGGIAKKVAVGAAQGAAVGAATGATVAEPDKGAMAGAVAGGTQGAVSGGVAALQQSSQGQSQPMQQGQAQDLPQYQKAYTACMEARGYATK